MAALTPPVGMKRTCGNGPASARIVAGPPLASAGKNFSSSQPWSSAAITSDAVDTPGITGIAKLAAALDDARAEPRRDNEPRAGVARKIDLLRADHRAGSDKELAVGGERAKCTDRRFGAERHLGDRQAAALERGGERADLVDHLRDDHGDHASGAQEPKNVLIAHRASHPPSTAMIVPQT